MAFAIAAVLTALFWAGAFDVISTLPQWAIGVLTVFVLFYLAVLALGAPLGSRR